MTQFHSVCCRRNGNLKKEKNKTSINFSSQLTCPRRRLNSGQFLHCMATNGSRSDSNAIKALENSSGLQASCNYMNRIHKRAVVLSVIFVLNP